MNKRLATLLFPLLLAITTVRDLSAQDARSSVQTVLGTMVPNRQLPNDITLTGQLTDPGGIVRPFRIIAKGKDQVRYEVGTGLELVTTVQTKGAGWTEAAGKVTFLQTASAIRRPGIVPFLDLLAEADRVELQAADRGLFTIGSTVTRRFSLKLPDPTPNARLFRRALDEETEVYVDAQTALVVRSESWVTAENSRFARAQSTLEFSDYRSVSGLAVPFLIRNTIAMPGQRSPQWVYAVQNVTVNSGVPDSTFTQERSR